MFRYGTIKRLQGHVIRALVECALAVRESGFLQPELGDIVATPLIESCTESENGLRKPFVVLRLSCVRRNLRRTVGVRNTLGVRFDLADFVLKLRDGLVAKTRLGLHGTKCNFDQRILFVGGGDRVFLGGLPAISLSPTHMRWRAGDNLVENRPKQIDIAMLADLISLILCHLRSHEFGCPTEFDIFVFRLVDGQSPVAQVDFTERTEHHIFRL